MERLNNINNNKLSHIIGFADLHVRTGDREQSRSTEYKHVFNNFIADIGTLECIKDETAVIILAGDVFHNKGRIETAGMKMVLNFMNRLLNMAPVLVIAGNHDFRQENPAYMDTIEMLIAAYEFSSAKFPLHYLQRTGHYLFNDIGIGMCSVKETLRKFNTSGITSDLPAFPDPDVFKSVSCRVALFHGSISQSALPNGRSVDSIAHGYPLEWFKGYDIAVLGDNHKQQLNLDDFISWGYPGSLIQQDHGEPIMGHGYLLWDVATRTADVKHICNQFGHVTILRTALNEFMVRLTSNNLITIAEAVAIKDFPKTPRVRMVNCAGFEKFVSETLKLYGICPSFIKTLRSIGSTDGGAETEQENSETTQLQDVNSPAQWDAYMRLNAPDVNVSDWIYKPETLLIREEIGLPTEIIAKIRIRNKTLQQCLTTFEAAMQDTSTKYSIVFKHMEWSYLMCFGETNYFDFERCESCDTISLLNGANASGKSSYLDVVCIAIFGDPTSSRNDTGDIKISSSIIHNDKPSTSQSGVSLIFTLNGVLFEIRRTFSKVNDNRHDVVTAVYEIGDHDTAVLVAEGNTMVGEWVKRRFGTLNEFMMSSVICQMDNKSFFYQGSSEQKDIIDKALNLDMTKSFQDYLDEARKAYRYIANDLSTYIVGFEKGMPTSAESATTTRLRLKNKKGELDAVTVKIERYSEETKGLLMKLGEYHHNEEQVLDEEQASLALVLAKEAVTSAKENMEHLNKSSLLVQQGELHSQLTALRGEQRLESFVSGLYDQKLENKAIRALAHHDKKRPAESSVTRAFVEEKQAEYDTWLRSSPELVKMIKSEIITNTAALELEKVQMENELHALNEHPIVQPRGATASACMGVLHELRIEMENTTGAVEKHLMERPREVTASRKTLEDARHEWRTWSKRQNSEWLANPASVEALELTLNQHVNKAEQQVESLHGVVKPVSKKPRNSSSACGTLDDVRCLLNEKYTILHTMEESMSLTPERPESGLEKWLVQLAQWRQLEQRLPADSLVHLKQHIVDTMDNITLMKTLETEHLHLTAMIESLRRDVAVAKAVLQRPHNEKCKACIANQAPAQVRLGEKQIELSVSEESLQQVSLSLARLTASDLKSELEKCKSALATRETFDQNSKRMEEDIRAWAASADVWTCEKARQELRKECDELSWALWESWNAEMTALKSKRDTARADAAQCRQFVVEVQSYTASRDRAMLDLEALEIFEAWRLVHITLEASALHAASAAWNCWRNTRHNLQERLTQIARDLANLKTALKWSDDKVLIDAQTTILSTWEAWCCERTSRERSVRHMAWLKKMQSVEAEFTVNCKTLAEIDAFENALDHLSLCEKALLYIEYCNSSEQLDSLREQAEILLSDVATLEKTCEQISALAETSAQLNSAKACFLDIQERVAMFYDVFVGNNKSHIGFKTTLYKSRVIPLIESKVNRFIGPIEDIRLRIYVKNGKFVYYAEDRGNTPPFDNCSGYQKFIMGLGVRCALAEIGAVGQSVKHMFMDESFVACDSTNILKVRDILNELVRAGNYKSIIIMSHLDAIREVTSHHINIQRDSGKFSSIQFGRVYPKLKRSGKSTCGADGVAAPPKARGRPRKTK